MAESVARALPGVDVVLRQPGLLILQERVPWALLAESAREILDEARRAALDGVAAVPRLDDLVARIEERVERALRPPLRRVINATGVIVHTNLGRAPLSRAALEAVVEASQGYLNLEYDLEQGARGSRHALVTDLLRQVTGCQDALVVNNNAAALVLALSALSQGREAIISRGELVEIGGGFRIPDVMQQSGARLVEVGTTNRTYVEDYARAIGDQTALLVRVHASNFRLLGFVHRPVLSDLARLAHERGLLLLDDLGSGALLDTTQYGLAKEPVPRESLLAGADLVCFSGDKLLGGPQAGIFVGSSDVVSRLRRHPLTRAIRPDKMTLAALAATLRHYVLGEAEREIPVWRMIAAPVAELDRRAQRLRERLPGDIADVQVGDGQSAVGGGSLPGETLPARVVRIGWRRGSAAALASALRMGDPAVVGRVEDDRLQLDLRTVLPEEDERLCLAVRAALDGGAARG